jgi:pimeloyl-ACP methyl ester carboxylesterase
MNSGVFRSDDARRQFLTVYNRILASFPFTHRQVETSLGTTFLLEAGDPGSPPILLLHGSCSNSAFWFAEMRALSATFHVFAADIPGEAGNSAEIRPSLQSGAYSAWVREMMDALQLGTSSIAGNSLGGWIALHFAIRFPSRVDRLALLAPSGLTELSSAFKDEVMSADDRRADPDFLSTSILNNEAIPREVRDFMRLILDSFLPGHEIPPLFTDEALRALDSPVLLLIGEEDETFSAQDASQRINALHLYWTVRLIQGCGHVIPDTSDFLLDFFTGTFQTEDRRRVNKPVDETGIKENMLSKYTTLAKQGTEDSVSEILNRLRVDMSIAESKFIDYALGLVSSAEGARLLMHTLFNGNYIQRNYCALYFARRGEYPLLRKAYDLGLIDYPQLISR